MPEPSRRILALETSGRRGSAALATDAAPAVEAGVASGVRVVAAGQLSDDMRHASELMPTIDRLLKDQGWPADSITDVFVSIGPGSFTGLRIGVTIARTLGWSIGVRIVAVPTVDCLALNALGAEPPPSHAAVVLDAKRSQVYAAAFDLRDGVYTKTIDAHLADPREFFARCPRPLAVLGEGVPPHRPAIDESGVFVLDPGLWPGRAENVARVGLELADAGQFTPPGDLVPLYIRRPDVEEKWEKRHQCKTEVP